ncbi:MAG: aspartate kinase [Deltaproteobacteria bacterium]|nr:aspartate kinase [Deltaproteobacteria bacterium]
MPIVVQKYGGSSVADLDKLRRIADAVMARQRSGYDVVVVVSAMGKTTDQLLAQARELTASPPRRELDMLLTTGERVTMALLAIAIHERGGEAVSFTGSQAGITTNDRHSDARILEVRPFRVQDELARGKIVIVAGFQGVSYKREVTTLGRGGSDTTAVALAAALDAEACEIYSDVDGVYSADPRVVPGARHLPEISYAEMQEMAQAGAKVMNAQAVEFAKQAGIAIYARASFQPGRETVIRKGAPVEEYTPRAVVSSKNIARVRLIGHATGARLAEVLTLAGQHQIPLREVSCASPPATPAWSRASFLVPLENAVHFARFRSDLTAMLGDAVELDEHLGAVSVIGEGITRDEKVLLASLARVERLGIPLEGLSTTAFRISFLVPLGDVDRLVQDLHAVLVESNEPVVDAGAVRVQGEAGGGDR